MRWTLNLCVVPGLATTLMFSPAAFAEEAIDLDAVEAPQPAAATGTTVMVPNFEGARAKRIRARFVDALERGGMRLVPQSAAGRTKLGTDPANYIFVAQANGVQAFVKGKVKLTTKRWTLTLEVRSGTNGTVIGSDTISSGWLPGLLKAIDKEAKPKLEALLANSAVGDSGGVGAAHVELVAPEEAPKTNLDPATADASLTSSDTPSRDDRPAANQVPTALVVHAGGSLIVRNLSYADAYLDTLRQQLYPHGITLIGMNLGGMWYPGAHVTDGILGNLGLNVHFIRSFGGTTNVGADKVPTQVGAPPSYSTVFQELDLGIRGRIPMDSWEMGLNLGWGKQRMGLEGDNVVVRLPYSDSDEAYPGVIPDVDIEYYRFGADVGFELFDWSWVVGAGFRTPFYSQKPGQIANERWFPNIIGTTATANLGVNIPLFDQFGLAVNADFRQTGMDMNTQPNAIISVNNDDPNQNNLRNSVAGGATDRHILVTAAFTWSFGDPRAATPTNTDSSEEDAPDLEAESDTSSDEGAEPTEEEGSPTGDSEPAPPNTSPSVPSAKDTSDPSFFGEGTANTKAPPKPSPQPAQSPKDTSNPDFFK